MRRIPGVVLAAFLGGCASAPPDTSQYAQVDVSVLPECGKGTALIRELHSTEGNPIRSKHPPYRVPAGVYSIGVTCGTVLDEHSACIDTAAGDSPTDVAPYELVLRAKRRYTFSCSLFRRQHVVRLTETDL